MKQFVPLNYDGPVQAILSNIPFLGGISDAQRRLIFSYFETASYEVGEYIARKDETPSHIYIIKSGSVSLVLEDSKSAVSKRHFGEGDSFGEAALLSLVNNSASFVADEACELIVLSRRGLNELRKRDPEVFCHLMVNMARELARKLQYTDEMLLRGEYGKASRIAQG
jgi:CRP-like cAMP-binding protein